ncbi:ATP-binding protein [Aquisalimonas sp.]|uniref:PAS domain-containing sensor histidine kinase n=1 Tax=Aquisalimonas sp. TaxID=1872621 RepID=UPI0025BAF5A4|nr:ATP-binding protein [Aquisalimonas sp.]
MDFQQLFRAINEPVFVLDPHEGIIREVNDAAAELLELSRQELVGLPMAEIHPFEMNQFNAFKAKVLSQGGARTRALTCRNRSGVFIPAEVSASAVMASGQEYLLAVVRDLRQEPSFDGGQPVRRSEYRALQDELATTRSLIHHAPEMVLWVTTSGRVYYANQTASEVLGIERLRLEAMWIWDIDVDACAEEFPRQVEQFRKRKRIRFERRMLAGDGTVFPATVTVQLVQHGFEETLVSFSRDITEEVRSRDEARRYLSELARVSRQASVTELASAISHEINQPLTAMLTRGRSCLRMLEQGEPDLERLQQGLSATLNSAERISDIVSRLRDYMTSGEPQRRRIEVAQLIHDAAILLRADARHSGVELVINVAEGLPEVEVDSILIQQVILNLARNSTEAMLQHSSTERRLEVCAERDHTGNVVITVRDTGPGIEPERAARLFEPFFSTKRGGMGIGLSLCRSIIDSHQGRIWLDRPELSGTTFRFTLPTAASQTLSGRQLAATSTGT